MLTGPGNDNVMKDQYDKAISEMKERGRIREEEEQKARAARQAKDAEMLARWRGTHEKFARPNLEKLHAALVEAGYSNVSMDVGIPSPEGFIATISGRNPDDGVTRTIALRYVTSRMTDIPGQDLKIIAHTGPVHGTFDPNLEEGNFKTHVWPHFFPSRGGF